MKLIRIQQTCSIATTNQFCSCCEPAVPQTEKHHLVEEETLGDLPEHLRVIYIEHWDSIRTHCDTGGQDRYNICLPSTTPKVYAALLWGVNDLQKNAFKVNFNYGFISRNTITTTMRYWHTSQNRGRVLETPVVVRNRDDFAAVIARLNTVDVLEHARQERPNSQWIVDLVTNVTVYVNKLHDHSI